MQFFSSFLLKYYVFLTFNFFVSEFIHLVSYFQWEKKMVKSNSQPFPTAEVLQLFNQLGGKFF